MLGINICLVAQFTPKLITTNIYFSHEDLRRLSSVDKKNQDPLYNQSISFIIIMIFLYIQLVVNIFIIFLEKPKLKHFLPQNAIYKRNI